MASDSEPFWVFLEASGTPGMGAVSYSPVAVDGSGTPLAVQPLMTLDPTDPTKVTVYDNTGAPSSFSPSIYEPSGYSVALEASGTPGMGAISYSPVAVDESGTPLAVQPLMTLDATDPTKVTVYDNTGAPSSFTPSIYNPLASYEEAKAGETSEEDLMEQTSETGETEETATEATGVEEVVLDSTAESVVVEGLEEVAVAPVPLPDPAGEELVAAQDDVGATPLPIPEPVDETLVVAGGEEAEATPIPLPEPADEELVVEGVEEVGVLPLPPPGPAADDLDSEIPEMKLGEVTEVELAAAAEIPAMTTDPENKLNVASEAEIVTEDATQFEVEVVETVEVGTLEEDTTLASESSIETLDESSTISEVELVEEVVPDEEDGIEL